MSDISEWVEISARELQTQLSRDKVSRIFSNELFYVQGSEGHLDESGLFLSVTYVVRSTGENIRSAYQYHGPQDSNYLFDYLRADPPKITKPEDFIIALLMGGKNGHF